MSTWNFNVWKKCGIHVPDWSEFLNTTNVWLTSLHSTETLGYVFFWLCSLPKYEWMKDYPVVGGDSTKGHTFHTLLRSFLPVHGFMHEFTCLWSKYLMLKLESNLKGHLPAPSGHETVYYHVDKRQESVLSMHGGWSIQTRWDWSVLAAVAFNNSPGSSTCWAC